MDFDSLRIEILRLRRTQDQPLGLDAQRIEIHVRDASFQNALMPVNSRPTTSSCTVSVPS
jgi:hypothetical protein